MKLVRADKSIFSELETQWRGLLARFDEELLEYMASKGELAHSVIADAGNSHRVYVLDNGL